MGLRTRRTIASLERCIDRRTAARSCGPSGRQTAELERWFENDLVPRFQGRILPVTQSIADRWGVLDGECRLKGAPLNTADGMIAATAVEHDLTVVTRNVRDFAGLGVQIFNPWEVA